MNFNSHSALANKHAFLSASQNSWTNYTDEKLEARFMSQHQAKRGTQLHALADNAIKLGVKLDKSNKALATYVNDAINFKMESEQPLYYSDNCFGTPDAICFRRKKLRIHDLKTGIGKVTVKQLEVYAAMFCLEYEINPSDISIEMRIYQNEDIFIYDGDPVAIRDLMGTIVEFDIRIEFMKEKALLG